MEMKTRVRLTIILLMILAFGLGGIDSRSQTTLNVKDIFEKNLQASGGREKIAAVKNFSFKTGQARTFVSAAGEMKILTGKDPVVTEAILVQGDSVKRNAFNELSEITGIRKATYLVQAKLFAGLFSLLKFEGRLTLAGLKSFGPEKFYDLAAQIEGLKVDFFVRAEDFLLKRLLFQGQTPEGDKYEVNYDFAPFENAEGVLIPLSWFSSQVGTRGALTEISEVKLNLQLIPEFFAEAEVNFGTIEAAPGMLKGNILDVNQNPAGVMITTNWTKKDIDKAGLKTGDALALVVGDPAAGLQAELVFYAVAADLPPQNALAKGARILGPMPRGSESFVIQLIGGDTAPFAAGAKILAPLEIRKK
jgi:hypothetical protein